MFMIKWPKQDNKISPNIKNIQANVMKVSIFNKNHFGSFLFAGTDYNHMYVSCFKLRCQDM